jgi:hypothetical protein
MLTVYATWAVGQILCEKVVTMPLPEEVNEIARSVRTAVSDRDFNCKFNV